MKDFPEVAKALEPGETLTFDGKEEPPFKGIEGERDKN
jgi:hypothetical protein